MTTSTRDQRVQTDEHLPDRGAGLVEYALLIALILVACLVSLEVFGVTNGGSINNTASSYGSALN